MKIILKSKPTVLLLFFALFLLLPTALQTQTDKDEDAISLYHQGMEAQANEQFYKAIELYKTALQINHYFIKPMKGLAQCFFNLGEYEEGLQFVIRAKKYDQSDLEILAMEGRIRIILGQLADARQLFNQILTQEPNNIAALSGLAMLDIAQGKTKYAARQYEKALLSSPSNKQAILSLAIIYQELGEVKVAEKYIELALKYHSNDPLTHFVSGKFYYKKRNYNRAQYYLNTALSLKQDYVTARQLLGNIYLFNEQYQAAIEEFSRITQFNNLARYAMGIASAKLGQIPSSINYFKNALNIRPDDEITRLAMENTAFQEIKESDDQRKELAIFRLDQGKYFEEHNFLDRAFIQYRRCFWLDPGSKEALFLFANIYKKQGFPYKYLNKIELLDKEFKQDNTDLSAEQKLKKIASDITDEIEIYRSKNYDTVSARWNMEQHELSRKKLYFSVFTNSLENSFIHPLAGQVLSAFFKHLLLRHENIALTDLPEYINSSEQAYRLARENQSDYFIVLYFNETERSIYINAELYLASTGTLLKTFNIMQTGNNRIEDALIKISDSVAQTLPSQGMLLEKESDKGIIDLGRMQGIKKDDRLLIIKKDRLRLKNNAVGFRYTEEDILGEFVVQELDEGMAQGEIVGKSFFDLVNPGDQVIFAQENAEQAEAETAAITPPSGLLNELMQLN